MYKIYAKQGFEYNQVGNHSTYESAENKINNSKFKNKYGDMVRIVPYPEKIEIGMKIYSGKDRMFGRIVPDKEEFLYGVIVKEDDNFWWVSRDFTDPTPVFFLKDAFHEKFVDEVFYFKEDDLY